MKLWFAKYVATAWLGLMIPFQFISTQEVSTQPVVERIRPEVVEVKLETPLTPRQVIKEALLNEQPDMKSSEIRCALEIVYRESRYNPDARNSSSGAQGAYQLMWGKPEWGLAKQTQQVVKYIDSRYDGSWCIALEHHDRKNWY
jgi:hypothetical protein